MDLITWLKHAIFFAPYVATNFVATSNYNLGLLYLVSSKCIPHNHFAILIK